MKAQYTDPTKYSVRLPSGIVVPRLLEYDWKRLGIDEMEAKGEIEEYVEPTYETVDLHAIPTETFKE